MLQGKYLAMIGLGNDASPGFDRGIHLRWSFDPALSFPRFGFDVYRRSAQQASCPQTCIDLLKISFAKGAKSFTFGAMTFSSTAALAVKAGTTGATAIVPAAAATYTLKFSQKIWEFSASEFHASGKVTLQAYDGTVLVCQVTRAATAGAGSVVIRADRIDKIVIKCSPAARIEVYRACWRAVNDCAGGDDWVKLASLNLPRDWTEAKGRIPATAQPAYSASYPRLDRIIKMVTSGATGEHEIAQTNAAAGESPASFRFYPVKLLLFTAADPNVARMLGVYFLDPPASASVGVEYDYKVVGNWRAATSAEHAWICFRLSRGTPAAVARPTGLRVTQRSLPGGIGGAPTSQVGAGLKWTVTRTVRGLKPGAPIMYHVTREDRKTDGTWTPAATLTSRAPVMVTAWKDPDTGTTTGLPAEYFYTDGPIAPGDYRYRILAVDIWGRKSTPTAAVGVTLVDDMPPPPPASVAATPGFQDGPTGSVTVKWSWTEAHQAQAGDAAEFRVHYQNSGIDPLASVITKVTDAGDTSELETSLATGSYADYVGGYLINNGRRFKVTAISGASSPVKITVENVEETSGSTTTTVTPLAAGASTGARSFLVFLPEPWTARGKFLLHKDWSDAAKWQSAYASVSVAGVAEYSKTLSAIDFGTSASAPTGRVMLGVCTVDAKGNVGIMSPPVIVSARHVAEVDAPPAPAGDTYASRADFYGNSYCTLSLSGSDYDSTRTCHVYRALDAALEAAAADAGATVSDTDYADDGYVRDTLAANYESAFGKVGEMQDDGSGASASYTDTVKGTGRNRYVYRLKAVDAAGNTSDFSAAILVKLHDVAPPKAPVVTKVRGGENQISVTWAPNADEGLTGYALYRSADESKAGDWRLMDPVVETDTATLEHSDTDVTPRTPYWYGVVAKRQNEEGDVLTSAMSRLASAQAYDLAIPDPPEFDEGASDWVYVDDDGTVYEWEADVSAAPNPTAAIRLVWSGASANAAEACIQSRTQNEYRWQELMDWSEGDAYAGESRQYLVTGVFEESTYLFRIKSRSRAGLVSTNVSEITIDAAGT